MLSVVLIFAVPLAWYIGVRMGYRRGAQHARLSVLRQLGKRRVRVEL